jgi:hypothetical protein
VDYSGSKYHHVRFPSEQQPRHRLFSGFGIVRDAEKATSQLDGRGELTLPLIDFADRGGIGFGDDMMRCKFGVAFGASRRPLSERSCRFDWMFLSERCAEKRKARCIDLKFQHVLTIARPINDRIKCWPANRDWR